MFVVPVISEEATSTATIFTSTGTFSVPGEGYYIVAGMGSGGTGAMRGGNSNAKAGGGSGVVTIGKVFLVASTALSVIIGQGITTTSSAIRTGTQGNPTKLGAVFSSPGGGAGVLSISGATADGGSGFCGGGTDDTGAGGIDGADGTASGDGTPGYGQGSFVIDYLNLAFPDVTFAASSLSTATYLGGGGISINGSGSYGQGGSSFLTGEAAVTISNSGFLVISGPYTSGGI